jgi:outer membrane protein assembly factor BamD (BamD/ComL family)
MGWFMTLSVFLAGCQSLGNRNLLAQGDSASKSPVVSSPVVQVSGNELDGGSVRRASTPPSLTESAKKSTSRVLNFVSGREQEDLSRAQQLYRDGDSIFRRAETLERGQREDVFADAAKLFRKSAEASKGDALQQDAMFMHAESLFFSNQLTQAAKVYEQLQKDFPRNRHNDRVSARLFSISKYWIDTVKADGDKFFTLNLTDAKRPRVDTDGHAIRVLDQIRYDDPTGRLADDATMAAAAEHIRQGRFEKADEFLTDLRETFTDSEHLFLAHLLGLKCKLEIYAGPEYSGLVLEEAEKLVEQTRQRFPDKLRQENYADMVARSAAEIAFHRAERLASKASWREKRKEYGAARVYYQELLEKFPASPQAEIARKRLAETEKLPAVPTPRLSWLADVFPDKRTTTPLKTIDSKDGSKPNRGTMLR